MTSFKTISLSLFVLVTVASARYLTDDSNEKVETVPKTTPKQITLKDVDEWMKNVKYDYEGVSSTEAPLVGPSVLIHSTEDGSAALRYKRDLRISDDEEEDDEEDDDDKTTSTTEFRDLDSSDEDFGSSEEEITDEETTTEFYKPDSKTTTTKPTRVEYVPLCDIILEDLGFENSTEEECIRGKKEFDANKVAKPEDFPKAIPDGVAFLKDVAIAFEPMWPQCGNAHVVIPKDVCDNLNKASEKHREVYMKILNNDYDHSALRKKPDRGIDDDEEDDDDDNTSSTTEFRGLVSSDEELNTSEEGIYVPLCDHVRDNLGFENATEKECKRIKKEMESYKKKQPEDRPDQIPGFTAFIKDLLVAVEPILPQCGKAHVKIPKDVCDNLNKVGDKHWEVYTALLNNTYL